MSGDRRSLIPAGVVFDLDGVIIDSEGVWDAVRRELAADHDRAWPASATADMMGMSSTEWSVYMRDAVGVPRSAEEINAEVVTRITRRYREGLPLVTGAVRAVRRLSRRYPLALATSSNREVITAVLAASGLDAAFTATVSSEEVAAGKPAPDVYLEAAGRLGLPASECAAVEDSANGIRSAAGGGMPVVAIPNREFPPSEEALALAAIVLPSIAALWPSVVAGLGSGGRLSETGR